MARRSQRGFTLYELLITVLVIGAILTLGIPNLTEFTRNSRLTAAANDLHASFLLARSEAARAKTNVTICASSDQSTCTGTLDDGWIVFVDEDGDIARDAGEAVLRRVPAVDSTINITPNDPAATYFSFAGTGLGRGNVNGVPAFQTAVICDDRGNRVAAGGWSSARALVVTPIGRATVLREVSQVTALGGCP